MPPWKSIYGAERARRRRIPNHNTAPAIKAAPTMPPTTPPAIVPAFELLREVGVGVGVEGESDPDALGVKVDCETLVIDKGIMETVPVTSGESGQEGKISICVCTEQKGFAPPTNCATEMFHLSPICKDEIFWASKRRHREETHNRCVEVGPLWYSRASRDRVREAGVEGLA